jgi:hypothetical protein
MQDPLTSVIQESNSEIHNINTRPGAGLLVRGAKGELNIVLKGLKGVYMYGGKIAGQ